MNKIRRITVLRSLLLDFFFDLRLAIVFPPAIHSKKERPRPIAQNEARQSPNSRNGSGRIKTVRTAALLFFEIGDFVLCAVYKHPIKPGYVKIKSL